MKTPVIITSGTTIEKIDRIHQLSNNSSGALGAQLADKFANQGFDVTYISNAGAIQPTATTNRKLITSAASLLNALAKEEKSKSVVLHMISVVDFTISFPDNKKFSAGAPDEFGAYVKKHITQSANIVSHLRGMFPDSILMACKSGVNIKTLRYDGQKLLENNCLDIVFVNDYARSEDKGAHFGGIIMNDWEENLLQSAK